MNAYSVKFRMLRQQRDFWDIPLLLALVISVSLLLQDASAQTNWIKSYGGTLEDYSDQTGNSIFPTSDGGYVVGGGTFSFSTFDVDLWVLKLDSSGNITWQKSHGIARTDSARSVFQTPDGGYMMMGVNEGFGLRNVWLLKLDQNGNTVWEKNYGQSGGHMQSESFKPTSDGGYVITGRTPVTGDDVFVMKVDQNGNLQWNALYGGSGFDQGLDILETQDGGFIVVSTSTSFGSGNFGWWILKLDSQGNSLWQKYFDGFGLNYPYKSIENPDGTLILVGFTESFGSNDRDGWIVKMDPAGNVLWQKRYGGVGSDTLNGIQPTSTGGYIIVGGTSSSGFGLSDLWLLKITDSGDVIWQKTYGGNQNEFPASAVYQTPDGGYITSGTTYSFSAGRGDIWVLKVNSSGEVGNSCNVIGTPSIVPLPTEAVPQDVASPRRQFTINTASITTTENDSAAQVNQQCALFNTSPDCTQAIAQPGTLWPPNHVFRPVVVSNVTDPDGDPVTITITDVFQDENINGLGDGDMTPDASLQPLMLRAERSGTGDGRVYAINFLASDDNGGICSGQTTLCVPRDKNRQCVDQGPLFSSLP